MIAIAAPLKIPYGGRYSAGVAPSADPIASSAASDVSPSLPGGHGEEISVPVAVHADGVSGRINLPDEVRVASHLLTHEEERGDRTLARQRLEHGRGALAGGVRRRR